MDTADSKPQSPGAGTPSERLWRAWPWMSWLVFPISALVKLLLAPGWEIFFFMYFGLPVWIVLALASWAPKKILATRGFDSAPTGVATAFLLHHSLVFLTLFSLPGITDIDQYGSPLTILLGTADATGNLRDFNDALLVASGFGSLLCLVLLWVLSLMAQPSRSGKSKRSPFLVTTAVLVVFLMVVGALSAVTSISGRQDAYGRTVKKVQRQGDDKLLEAHRTTWNEQQEELATLRSAILSGQWFLDPESGAQLFRYEDHYRLNEESLENYLIASQWSAATAMDVDAARTALGSALSDLDFEESKYRNPRMWFYTDVEDYESAYPNAYVKLWEPAEGAPETPALRRVRVTILPNEGSNRQHFPGAASIVRIQAESGTLFRGGHSTYGPAFRPPHPYPEEPRWRHPTDRSYGSTHWPNFDEIAQKRQGESPYQPPICWKERCPARGE